MDTERILKKIEEANALLIDLAALDKTKPDKIEIDIRTNSIVISNKIFITEEADFELVLNNLVETIKTINSIRYIETTEQAMMLKKNLDNLTVDIFNHLKNKNEFQLVKFMGSYAIRSLSTKTVDKYPA